MERSVPRAPEQKPGGLEVISWSTVEGWSVSAYTARKDRFSRPKNSSNTADTRHLPRWKMEAEIGPSVTTRQLFRPNQRRKRTLSLRFWLPNSDFPAHERRQGGG